jgi:hypothetical protein
MICIKCLTTVRKNLLAKEVIPENNLDLFV